MSKVRAFNPFLDTDEGGRIGLVDHYRQALLFMSLANSGDLTAGIGEATLDYFFERVEELQLKWEATGRHE